jgi:tetratricopeptide (TPR) repeat protein
VAVDWTVFASALQDSRDGQNLRALAVLSRLMPEAESDSDRAAIVLGESSCYSRLGDLGKSRELLELAKTYAQGDRSVFSQVALAEASLCTLSKEYELACEKFASVKSAYHDLLVQPEHDDFALELDSRFACALVDVGKFSEAVPLFRKLFERDGLEDRQRLQVYFSVALARTGHFSEAQVLLFEAAKGKDAALCQTALEYLARFEKVQ